MLILLFKNVLKISNFEKRAKTSKNTEKTAKKNINFFLCMRFYLEGHNFYYKNCLLDAKFFEFEESTMEKFFSSSIQPQHTVGRLDTMLGNWWTEMLKS